MRKGHYYRPPNTTSIAAYIITIFTIPENGKASVKLEWYRCNKKGDILYPLGITQRFKKPLEYWKTWIRM